VASLKLSLGRAFATKTGLSCFSLKVKKKLFYSDWHGTEVPSGTVESEFLWPLIKTPLSQIFVAID
jgi:hypothetical protein